MKLPFKVEKTVTQVTETLQKGGFEAYLVGGCVRDLFMNNQPKDWDITTNARPEEIQALFVKTFYENAYGTVGVVIRETGDPNTDIVEVTPYRLETKYSDNRHPDSVSFSSKLEDDLKRRDFTINSLAYNPTTDELVDLFSGIKDIKDMVIRSVGNPDERITEDALRMLRAVRLATNLGFMINKELADTIIRHAPLLQKISSERIRDEFGKILMSKHSVVGLEMCRVLGLLKYIVPELEEGIGIKQNSEHIYEVWEHNMRALAHSAEREWPIHIRLAVLFHDIAKPRTRNWSEDKKDWTFYGHDVVGARVARKIVTRLHFSKKIADDVEKLVRYHMFFSDIDKITLSAVRRIVRNVGPELVWDLMKVRQCDRIGMGRPKEQPYRLRKYEAMIEEAMRSPTSVGMLKIDGAKIMEVTHETPGPRIGWILHALLEEALDNPEINTSEYLENRAKELAALPAEELKKLGEAGKEKKEEIEEAEIAKIREKHWVR